MGYLNNNVVTVDAILTKKGRELLAKGASSFNITQFALADDEIDYDLWNQSHPLGDDKMGVVIENLPITEAVPDETQSMKYKLITLTEGTKSIPYLEASTSSVVLQLGGGIDDRTRTLEDVNTNPNLTVIMKQWTEQIGAGSKIAGVGGYTFTLLDSTYFDLSAGRVFNATPLPMSGKSVTWNTTESDDPLTFSIIVKPGFSQNPELINGKSTKLIITNTKFGSRIVIPISFQTV
jgi:hypothetical protein